jgi:hypothetical protein
MKIKTIALFLLLATGIAKAGTFTVTNFQGTGAASPTNLVVGADGALLPAGAGVVAIGYLTIEDSALGPQAGNGITGADLAAGFAQFANSITVGIGANSGLYQGSIAAAIDVGSEFEGNAIYTIIGNGDTIASSTAALVYKHSFNFQNDGESPGGDVILGLNQTGTLLLGSNDGTAALEPAIPEREAFGLVPLIPEPSSALLGLVGIAFLGFRRRR